MEDKCIEVLLLFSISTMKKTFFLITALMSFSALLAQNHVVADSTLWQPNGKVNKMKIMGDTLVIAGDFNMVGPNTPYASGFDKNSKLITDFPHTDGEVTKAIADDKGGFYVAGKFTLIGGKRRGGIAYIDSNNNVTNFFEDRGIDGVVYDMQLKDSLLYIGGDFTGTNPFTGGGALIRVDTTLVDFSFPRVEGNVYASEPDGEGGVYIGGNFTKVGEHYRANLAHIDRYGVVTPWNPGTDNDVTSIQIDEKHIFVGGYFKYAGCEERNKLAVFEKGSNVPNSWEYDYHDFKGSAILCLLVYGGKLFAGSGVYNPGFHSFGNGGGSVVLIDRYTGKIINKSGNGIADVQVLEAADGIVYAGGDGFIQNSDEHRIASLDTNVGSVKAIPFPQIKGNVTSLKYHNNVLYIGLRRHGFGDGIWVYAPLKSFVPYRLKSQVSGFVYDLEVFNDSILVAVGDFKSDVDNQTNIVAYSTNTEEKYELPYQSTESLLTISLINTDALYIGGYFRTVTTGIKNNFIVLDINTSKQSNRNFNFNNPIRAIVIDDSSIFIGGAFSRINFHSRIGLAKLNLNDTALPNWNANLNRFVNNVIIKGDSLIVSGEFTKIGASNIKTLAAINKNSALPYPWNPNVAGYVANMLLHNSQLFIGGTFSKVDTSTRIAVASIDVQTGAVNPFKASTLIQGTSTVEKLTLWQDKLVCGGLITSYFDNPRRFIALYDINTGAEVDTTINTSYNVRTLAASKKDVLFLGGLFRISGGVVRRNIAFIDLKIGKPYPWHADIDEEVFDFDIADGKIYYSGLFQNVKGQSRYNAAASYLSDASLHHWNPNPSRYFDNIHIAQGRAFVSGPFVNINGISRKYLTALDTGTALPYSFNPFSDANFYVPIYEINSYKNQLFVGGGFLNFDTIPRQFLTNFDIAADTLLNFDPEISGRHLGVRVDHMFKDGNSLYFGGSFTHADSLRLKANGFLKVNIDSSHIDTSWFPNSNEYAMPFGINNNSYYLKLNKSFLNNECRCYVSSIDTNSKQLSPWHPQIGSVPKHIAFYNDKVYLSGDFTTFNYKQRDYLAGVRIEAIAIAPITNNQYCRGADMNIKINTSGNFNISNKFILMMSDTMGSFTNPLYLDTITSATDSFQYKIPTNFPPNTNYRLRLISTSPSLLARDETIITILPTPQADFRIKEKDLCPNEEFEFTNTSNMEGSMFWKFRDGNSDTNAVQKHKYVLSGNYDVRLVLTPNGVGCPKDSIEKPVEVLPLPSPSYTVNDSVLCNHNDTFNFTNTSTISQGTIASYLWYFGNGVSYSVKDTSVSYADTGVYNIKLIAVSDSGCVDSITRNVYVIDKPQVSFSTNDTFQCFTGNNFAFTDLSTVSPYSTNITYSWDFGDTTFSTQQNPSHSYTDTGYYFVTLEVTHAKNCFDTTRSISIVAPEPEIDTILGPTIVKMQDTSTYTITTDTFTTYFWSVDFGALTHGIDSSYSEIIWDSVPTFTNTTIKIFPINVVGCFGDTAYLNVQISPFPIGVPELRIEKVKVFPNPAKSSLFIEFENDIPETKILKLFDVQGKEVLSKTYGSSSSLLELDVSSIKSGNYQLVIQSNSFTAQSKIIIRNE